MRGTSGAPLKPERARVEAIRLLEARGFRVLAHNARGDACYLAPDGATRTLRVSNHPRTQKQRHRHPEVVTSLVIRTPTSPAQVACMVEIACAAYARAVGAAPIAQDA